MSVPRLPPPEYYAYTIGRQCQGVFTPSPYKSLLLPLWRFRTPAIATSSASSLFAEFLKFHEAQDFVGMDWARKFIQMGMTRSKRYGNWEGGRKYKEGGKGETTEKGKGSREMVRSSEVFKAVLERCKEHGGYKELKIRWEGEKREWLAAHESDTKKEVSVKEEPQEPMSTRSRIKEEDVGE